MEIVFPTLLPKVVEPLLPGRCERSWLESLPLPDWRTVISSRRTALLASEAKTSASTSWLTSQVSRVDTSLAPPHWPVVLTLVALTPLVKSVQLLPPTAGQRRDSLREKKLVNQKKGDTDKGCSH